MRRTLQAWWTRFAKSRQGRLGLATARSWKQARVSRLAASLSFYALLSLVPLLITFHAIFSLVIDEQALASGVDAEITELIGQQQAAAVRSMVSQAQPASIASWQALIGSLLTFVTAGGVFIELKDSMDSIWVVPKQQRSGLVAWITAYFAPLSMVLGFGFLLLVSLLLQALLSMGIAAIGIWESILMVGNLIIGWIVATLLFAAIFRFLPTASIAWRDVWLGAIITATLFQIGRGLISAYIGQSDFSGKYGAAGPIIAIIVWIYYSAQILFTGAVFTREHARLHHRYRGPDADTHRTRTDGAREATA